VDQNKKINNHYVENVVCIFFIFDHILNEIIFIFIKKKSGAKEYDTDEK
tara:strand:+ start:851 stop:997 length:147 start_codon:yes stop_codon:yes gene_type:complete